MTTTNFPNGLTSFGIPLFGGGPGRVASGAPGKSVGAISVIGNTWFVDTVYGGNGNDGSSPQTPFATMARAFQTLSSGDVINFRGKINEQLVTPVNVFDVWINGLGNRPRHADATPVGGQYAASQWSATGLTAATASLRVLQQGWRFSNFLFTAVDANAACVEIVRNAGAGDLERDASHAQFLGMRFSGAGIGIRGGVAGLFTEIPFNVEVGYSQFDNMTYAMLAAIQCNQWFIHDNFFAANTNQITMPALNFLIRGNSFGAFTVSGGNTGGIDLTGGTGTNQVTRNNLSGTYSIAGGYRVGGAGDNWYGNASSAGFTSADPA
jgi:hypothetical protein